VVLDVSWMELACLRTMGMVALSLRFLVLCPELWMGLGMGLYLESGVGPLVLRRWLYRLVSNRVVLLVVVWSWLGILPRLRPRLRPGLWPRLWRWL
jgi:hypothetical protein